MTVIVMTNAMRAIIRFCADEVDRQYDGPRMVPDLIDAWVYAVNQYEMLSMSYDKPPISVSLIKAIGALAKPEYNDGGFRTYPISIAGNVRNNQSTIHRSLEGLCEAYNEGRIDAQTLYEEYEFIHPFGDGNGRTGKILFNWANGTLEAPVMPENRLGWRIP